VACRKGAAVVGRHDGGCCWSTHDPEESHREQWFARGDNFRS
jgi:hypothetical protein